MVAAFILLVCIVPMVRIFTSIYQSQQETVRKNARDHLARHIHAKFTEKLYKREIPLKDVLEANIPIILNDAVLAEELMKYSYECKGVFILIPHISRIGGFPTQYLAELDIEFVDKKQKVTSIKNNNPEDPNHKEGVYKYFIFIELGTTKKSVENNQNPLQRST